MPRISVRLLFVLSLLPSCPAYPWVHDAHQTIGAVTDGLIKVTSAARRVSELVGSTVEKDSSWADRAGARASMSSSRSL